MFRKNLIILIFLTILIFILLPTAPFLRDNLKKFLGEKSYKIVWGALCTTFLLPLLYLSLKKPWRFILLLLLSLFFLIKGAPEEKFHLLIYFLMGNFSRKCFKNYGIIYFIAVALIDETLQYFLPSRYFDLKDIILNIGGGITGFLF